MTLYFRVFSFLEAFADEFLQEVLQNIFLDIHIYEEFTYEIKNFDLKDLHHVPHDNRYDNGSPIDLSNDARACPSTTLAV